MKSPWLEKINLSTFLNYKKMVQTSQWDAQRPQCAAGIVLHFLCILLSFTWTPLSDKLWSRSWDEANKAIVLTFVKEHTNLWSLCCHVSSVWGVWLLLFADIWSAVDIGFFWCNDRRWFLRPCWNLTKLLIRGSFLTCTSAGGNQVILATKSDCIMCEESVSVWEESVIGTHKFHSKTTHLSWHCVPFWSSMLYHVSKQYNHFLMWHSLNCILFAVLYVSWLYGPWAWVQSIIIVVDKCHDWLCSRNGPFAKYLLQPSFRSKM